MENTNMDTGNNYNTIYMENESENNDKINKRQSSSNHSNDNIINKITNEILNENKNNDIERIGAEYIPDLHDYGMRYQKLTKKVNDNGIPGQCTPYHLPQEYLPSEMGTEYDEHGFPVNNNYHLHQKKHAEKQKQKNSILNQCCNRNRSSSDDGNANIDDSMNIDDDENAENKDIFKWSKDGKLKLSCAQPVVPVPIVQDILRRDKIILIPQVEVTDVIAPKVYNQNIKHEVPKVEMKVKDTFVEIPNVKYVEKEIIVPIITGYTHKFIPKWEIHEVPRPIMKYIGEQKIVEVEVPEIKYVDKIVEREVVVDTVEKRVPKIIEIPKYTDEVQYVWKPIEKIVYVQKLVPKFDVNLECPPPLIVPYPIQTVKHIPPIMIKKNTKIPYRDYDDCKVPSGSVKVPEEYIQQFSKHNKLNTNIYKKNFVITSNNGNMSSNKNCILNCCGGNNNNSNSNKNEENSMIYLDVSPSNNQFSSNHFSNNPFSNNMNNEQIYYTNSLNMNNTSLVSNESKSMIYESSNSNNNNGNNGNNPNEPIQEVSVHS